MVTEAREKKLPLALLMIDIDHFKRVNDTYGHSMGDQVLRIVAASIMASIRDGDVPARYGGDEFGVLLSNTDLATGKLVAERVGQAIAGRELIKRSTGENLGRVTVSIGVAQLRDSEPIEQFTEHADKCLYSAKRAGRDRVVCELDV
jgi:diguanylate cyclase